MPQIICKGMNEQEVLTLSEKITGQLSALMDTPQDWFMFEYQQRKCFVMGKPLEGDPIVDIWWFDRGQEIKDKTALIVDSAVRGFGYEQIEVVFHESIACDYYENGKHY